MTRVLEIVTGDDQGQGFLDAWKAAARGEAQEARQVLAFAEPETLFKVLSAPRLQLLRVLHQAGHISVRELSRRLGRDYKGVHTNVVRLQQAGLIEYDADGLIFTPYDRITTQVDLAA